MNQDRWRLIEELAANPKKFRKFVYTPLGKADEEFEKRRKDRRLASYVRKSLPAGLPAFLRSKKKRAVLCRQLATPNNETRSFLRRVGMMKGFEPLVAEYSGDRFDPQNEAKRALGKLPFAPLGYREGMAPKWYMKAADLKEASGKPISEARTLWGQELAAFHHELLASAFPQKAEKGNLCADMSDWLAQSGGKPEDFYPNLLRLFLRDAVLFEDFMLDEHEMEFTKTVFLESLIEIMEETGGAKPIIVRIDPSKSEHDNSWTYYRPALAGFVKKKLAMRKNNQLTKTKMKKQKTAKSDIKPLMIEMKPSKMIPSEIGVFAARDIRKDTVLAETVKISETFVPWSEFRKIDKVTQAKILQFCLPNERGFFRPDDLNYLSTPWSFNHCCEYNVGYDRFGNFVAARGLKRGEELFIDYGMSGSGSSLHMECLCRSRKCRKLITGFDWKDRKFVKKNRKYFLRELLEKSDSLSRK